MSSVTDELVGSVWVHCEFHTSWTILTLPPFWERILDFA
ncbi:hypothetical protein LEP1GSC194_3352 [Leptospira alstonii serovar Sichuan str. 79601]|uniref:Uncharacterized protein n=1 Tax=Leptospira alstonii serovar Sichuan str. 79601 TaxID=1218565 RepID=M6CV75_9LEPT|nr:hypothetical protein LEP1GSC194_3352 [Leptospira alstonii serovar Sichuan str. 79601]